MATMLEPLPSPAVLGSVSWNPPSPPEFTWTAAEECKIATLARFLHCGVPTVRQLLVFFLRYVHENQRGLAVAQLPEVLADFPIKWGYKKKRNDFFKLLLQMDFIYVKINFRPRVRAKTYALAGSGLELIERLGRHEVPSRSVDVAPRPCAI